MTTTALDKSHRTDLKGLGLKVTQLLDDNDNAIAVADIVAGNFSNTATAFTVKSAGTIAAAGSVQGNATAITTEFVVVTGANASKGAVLPAALAGRSVLVKNADAANATLLLYPAGTDTINALSAGTDIVMAAKTAAVLFCPVAGAWYTIPLLPS